MAAVANELSVRRDIAQPSRISSFGGPLASGGPDRALLLLGKELKRRGYRYTAVTPATHGRVLARARSSAATLTDVFGWSRAFAQEELAPDLYGLLAEAGELLPAGPLWRSAIRFSTLGNQVFAHSAYPTAQADAVFFGPDTYRFARLIRQSLDALQDRERVRLIDIGAGSGAGGLYARSLLRGHASLTLTDINPRAVRLSRVNAALNGIGDAEIVESDLFAQVGGPFDLIMSNPPYLVDPLQRTYRHGGGPFGSDLSVRIIAQGIDRLAPGGRLILYTGSAIVDGVDGFHETVSDLLRGRKLRFAYEEIDPDVFGEELGLAPYDRADRIAVVAVTVDRPARSAP